MLGKQRQGRKMLIINSTSKLQQYNGLTQFEKLYLNLCTFRKLFLTCNLGRSFNTTVLYMLNGGTGIGRFIFNRAALKGNKILSLRISKSNLFQSEIANGKKKYLKTSVL